MPNLTVDATRATWGGSARPRPLTPVTHPYAEVHHDVYDASLPAAEHCRAIEKQHLAQGWNGAFYNLGVDLDGRVWELRGPGWRSIGSHAARYDDGTPVSAAALTVVLFGNYEHTTPTSRQRDTLRKIAGLMPDPRLRWHQMRAATACPGTRAIPVLEAINTTPPPVPPEVDDDMLLLIKAAGTDPVYLTDLRYRWPVRTQARLDILTTPMLGATIPGPGTPWHEWTKAQVDAIPLAPEAVDTAALAAAIAARLPAGSGVDPDTLAEAVADELAGRLAS